MQDQINIKQAYRVMFEFAHKYYEQLGEATLLKQFLSDTQILPSGYIADPASWEEWLDAVKKVVEDQGKYDFNV